MPGCWAEEDDSVLLKLPSLFTRHQLTSSAPVSSSGNYQHLGQRRNLTRGENPPKPRTLLQLQTQRIRYKRPAASLCLAATEQFLLQPVSSARLRGRCWRWGRHQATSLLSLHGRDHCDHTDTRHRHWICHMLGTCEPQVHRCGWVS